MGLDLGIKSLVVSTMLFSTVAVASSDFQTDTGLDQIVEIIQTDKRLLKKVSEEDRAEASQAAYDMNQIIIEAIVANGLANDQKISTADAREMNDYIFANYHDAWVILHGDDEDNGEETGFHLVQNDGARTKLFGKNAINKVADGIYHLGFESHRKNRLLNEDGNNNVSFANVGKWLSGLLVEDLQGSELLNLSVQETTGSTGTGLDQVIDIIYNDARLQKRISTGDMRQASESADEMNKILIQAIQATGVASDGTFSKDDAKALNAYIVGDATLKAVWHVWHGDDEENEETGYHLAQNDGAKTKIAGRNAINKVFDSIYHLGYETEYNNRLVNEDGNKNASFKNVAAWLNVILADDLASGSL